MVKGKGLSSTGLGSVNQFDLLAQAKPPVLRINTPDNLGRAMEEPGGKRDHSTWV